MGNFDAASLAEEQGEDISEVLDTPSSVILEGMQVEPIRGQGTYESID